MTTRPATDTYTPPNNSARTIATWVAGIGLVAFIIYTLYGMASRVKPKSFAILYPENGGRNALLVLLGLVALIAVTSYIGKLIGERARAGRKVDYFAVLTDQLTHLFMWIVILFSLYPIVYIFSASLDPLNQFVSGDLGQAGEPLLVRARVLPSLEGKNLSNYAKLFDGVTIYAWQWGLLALAGVGVLWLAGIWFAGQQNGGIATPTMRRQRLIATYVAVAAVAVFFLLLMPGQFGGFGKGAKFLLWMRNTFVISGLTGALAVLLVTTAGYAIARLKFPGRFQMLMFFIFIQMFPGFLGFVAIAQIMFALGLTNTFPGLILAYSGGVVAFGTWIYKGFVEGLPASLEEAALVDGCTRWTAFTKIVLPLSAPMLVFIFLNQFIGTYAEFYLANILLTGQENWNIGVGLRSLAPAGFNVQDFGTFAAAAILGSLPIVILYYSFQQVFVSGALAGGVKE
jgi:arabinogalactan oligomer / maltooligosaccharide transport system permease protein